mgnify:CR=1 FL=1|tara:strand:- start:2845 stop:3807 length:963 start_codon:yes stop_codon:yes gene_type:complete
MLLQIFKSNQSIVGLLVVLFSVLLWVPGFFVSQEEIVKLGIVTFNEFDFLFQPRWLNVFLTSLLIGGQAIFLNYIINSNKVLKSTTFLVALFYVLIYGSAFGLFSLNLILIVNTFVLLVLHQLFMLYNSTQVNATLFNLGFFVGIASVLYNPLLILFPLVIFSIAYIRTPKGKDFLILIIGFLIPFIYWVSYLYLTNQLIPIIDNYLLFHYAVVDKGIFANSYFLYLLGLFSIIAIFNMLAMLGRKVVKTRKLLIIVLLLLLVSLATYFYRMQDFRVTYLILGVPIAIILAHFFLNMKRKMLAELIFVMLIVGLVLDYFL